MTPRTALLLDRILDRLEREYFESHTFEPVKPRPVMQHRRHDPTLQHEFAVFKDLTADQQRTLAGIEKKKKAKK